MTKISKLNTMWNELQIQYSDAYEIAEALINNEVSLDQLKSVPTFAAKDNLVEERVWDIMSHNNAFHRYLELYPNGRHAEEAKKHINEWDYPIQGIPDRHWFEKRRVIDALADDRNAYSLDYLKSMEFFPNDFVGVLRDSKGQVRNEVLKSWEKEPCHFTMDKMPESITTGTTEVYFWGIPSTGHTCLIAAILNAAKRKGVYYPRSEEGVNYMNKLASVFDDDSTAPAIPLLNSTAVEGIQCLPLSLVEYRGKKQVEHRLSVVENSGEIFECFSAIVENKPLKTENHAVTFKQLIDFLQSKVNPKYHFFIVDAKPGLDNRLQRYLEDAMRYFEQSKIFNRTTQGISIIVTKCDELSPDSREWSRLATEYVGNCYLSFANRLKQHVRRLGINDGRLEVIPFSIGEVFLKSLCLFNPEPAERMVKMLMDCSPAHTDWLTRIRQLIQGGNTTQNQTKAVPKQ